MANSVDRWNSEYTKRGVEPAASSDPVLNSALVFFGDLAGRRVLDLGCGNGGTSLFLAARGAEVIALDTSLVAIDNLRRYCVQNGVANIHPVHGSAMDIAAYGPFDFAYGSMILHHIEPLETFAALLTDSLTPGGRAFFYENSAMSSLLIWFREHVVGRFWVPKYGDDEEFPLTPAEVAMLRRHFQVAVVYPELWFFRLISDYIFRGRLQGPFKKLDDIVFQHVPAARKYSYRQYVYLTAPNR